MPTFAQILARTGRRPTTDLPLSDDLFDRIGAGRPGRGVLGTIGWILDTPARGVRSALTGKWGATERDLLKTLGLAHGGRQRGFDWAALGIGILTDPLTYAGGIGALTKAGKAGKGLVAGRQLVRQRALRLKDAIRAGDEAAIEAARTSLREAGQGALAYKRQLRTLGAPERFPASWAEQGRLGQRQVLGYDIPWGPKGKIPIRGEERILGGLQTAGRAIKASPPGAILGRIFRLPHAGSPAEGLYHEQQRLLNVARIEEMEELRRIEGQLEEAAKAAGMSVEEAHLKTYRGAEALDVPQRAGREIGRLMDRRDALLQKLEQRAYGRRAKEVQGSAAKRAQKLKTEADLKWREKHYEGALVRDRDRMRILGEAAARAERLAPAELRKLGEREARVTERFRQAAVPLATARERAKEILAKVPAGARHLPGEMEAGLRATRRMENIAGGTVAEHVDPLVGYMHRLATPEFRALKGELRDPFVRSLREQAITHGAQIRREAPLAGKYIDEATEAVQEGLVKTEKLTPEQAEALQVFSTNPALSYTYRRLIGKQSVINAQLGRSLAKEFADVAGEGMPVTEFFAKAGIDAPAQELVKKQIPHAIADEFLRTQRKLSAPGELARLGRVLEGVRRGFAQWLLIPFPAYHIRNLESNILTTWLAGFANVRNYIRAAREYYDPKLNSWYEKQGVLKGGVLRAETGASARREFAERVFELPPKGLAKLASAEQLPVVGKVFRAGYRAGDAVEGISRIAHYLGARDAGMSVTDAVASVRKYLFNADELSDIEKKYLRPFIFFYSWNRKMVQRLGESFFEHPQKMAMMSRLVTQPSVERVASPEWLRTTAALPVGRDLQGNQTYMSGLGTPLEALQNVDLFTGREPGVLGAMKRAGEKLASMASPPYKQAAEILAGRDLRLQRPIEELDKAYPSAPFTLLPSYKVEKLPGGKERPRADPHALWALRQTPFSRIIADIGRGSDPTKTKLQQVLNTMTGIKTVSVNEKEELRRLLEQALEYRLRKEILAGKAKRYQGFFARGAEGEKDPETQRLLALLRSVQKARQQTQ